MRSATVVCPHTPSCTGCAYIGEPYAAELRAKVDEVRRQISRAPLRSFNAQRLTDIQSSRPRGYRNRAKLGVRVGSGRIEALGVFREGTHEVVDIPDCPVQTEAINSALRATREALDRFGIPTGLRTVTVRRGSRTGETLIGVVTRGLPWPNGGLLAEHLLRTCPGVVGVVENIQARDDNVLFGPETHVLAGRPWIRERVNQVVVRLGITSFFQVNTAVAELAYAALITGLRLEPTDHLLDLYAGVGAIGFHAAPHVAHVTAIEEIREAIELGEGARDELALSNVSFVCGLVEECLAAILGQPQSYVVAVNPPRKGLDPEVLRMLGAARPRRIGYLSCEPQTLMRDLAMLESFGYRIAEMRCFDMFPQTDKVETLAILSL